VTKTYVSKAKLMHVGISCTYRPQCI